MRKKSPERIKERVMEDPLLFANHVISELKNEKTKITRAKFKQKWKSGVADSEVSWSKKYMTDELQQQKQLEQDEQADSLYQEAMTWAEDTIWSEPDNEALRSVQIDEDGRLFFNTIWTDFDKDDHARDRMYLDEFDGWDKKYRDPIAKSGLTVY